FSSRRRHTRWPRDWSSDVCSSDLLHGDVERRNRLVANDQLGSDRESASDGDALALPARELVRVFAHVFLPEADPREQGTDLVPRSEERRVGKEGRSWWRQERYREK